MISTFRKKIIGMQKLIKPYSFRGSNGVQQTIIYKGYEPHFQWIQQNQSLFTSQSRFYCYDRFSVDVALEMALRKVNKLSYISTRNYETISAVRSSSKSISEQSKQQIDRKQVRKFFTKTTSEMKTNEKNIISREISNRAKNILQNYDFALENTYLDIHPLEAYQKMCGYLMVRSDPNILKYFQGFKITQETIFKSFLIVPLLNQLRNKYLVVQGIKLGTIERNSDEPITKEIIESYLQRWREIVQLKTFQNARSFFDEKQKFQWVKSNNFGQEILKKDILNQKFNRYSYAIWP